LFPDLHSRGQNSYFGDRQEDRDSQNPINQRTDRGFQEKGDPLNASDLSSPSERAVLKTGAYQRRQPRGRNYQQVQNTGNM